MPSVQRFLSGHNNAARTAALSASSVRASRAIERVRAARTGGGNVRVGGNYTGHEATAIDVEIVAAGGIPRASRPQFAGVGNGQLSVQGVEAAAPLQSLTLTLADLGIPTQTASLDVRTVQIRARAAGAAGTRRTPPWCAPAPTRWRSPINTPGKPMMCSTGCCPLRWSWSRCTHDRLARYRRRRCRMQRLAHRPR